MPLQSNINNIKSITDLKVSKAGLQNSGVSYYYSIKALNKFNAAFSGNIQTLYLVCIFCSSYARDYS